MKLAIVRRSVVAALGALCLVAAPAAAAAPPSAATTGLAAAPASTALAAAPALAATTASAATTTTPALLSSNWAGYYAQVHGAGLPYEVLASFTVPAASCKNSAGNAPYYGAIWAGIGGIPSQDTGAWLEQAGVGVTCTSKAATPLYYLVWEIVSPEASSPYHTMPAQPFRNARGYGIVHAGDTINVSAEGQHGVWTFSVKDERTKQDYSHTAPALPAGTYTGRTVEVITEWPTGEAAKSKKLPSGLVDMGKVVIQQVSYDYTGMTRGEWYSVTTPVTMDDYSHEVIYPGGLYKTGQQRGQVKNSFATYYATGWQNGW